MIPHFPEKVKGKLEDDRDFFEGGWNVDAPVAVPKISALPYGGRLKF